ncbi:MAG TPA: hypothetical protein GX742_02050 [Acholeplasmataceae bacterium]|nr:hypothetical protein [Acholeplasmataceae bacterium]
MKKFLIDLIFPLIAFFIFATMLAAILVTVKAPLGVKELIAYSASPIAYSFMLTGLFIASRPRFLEKHIGMPKMYAIHAIMTLIAFILVFFHVANYWQGFGSMFRSPATIFGWLGALLIFLGLFSGALSLSGMFINKVKWLRNLKEKVFNREVMLWIHRIAGVGSIIAVYLQMASIGFLRANTLYMVITTFYTVLFLGYYFYWKLKTQILPKYKVSKIYKATPLLWVLEFEPVKGRIVNYTPGDYFFIRFKGDANITKEAHPFSTSSAITKLHDSSIEFMIKEAGDWTKALKNVKVGDIATLEGPYGDFYPQDVRESDRPFVLMGGGIGLTPNLSILRSEMDKGSQRKIDLVWALSYESDMFMLEELEAYKKVNPNFNYHIIFSNEEVEGYPFGFISHPYLKDIGVADIYQDATFFICGPDIMMQSTYNVLVGNGVPANNVFVDDFGF